MPLIVVLCPDHEQHSCLTIIEITDRCNLTCPTCYARVHHRPMGDIGHGRSEIDADTIVANEKEPDVVQISGGEPTLHPQFLRS